MVRTNPVMPLWTENHKGMQGPIVTNEHQNKVANHRWLMARDQILGRAQDLDDLGIHKQNINRLLEPWMHIKIILTGTDFDNWFELRDHEKAHPEIRELARMMKYALDASTPKMLQPGEWHIPFGDNIDFEDVYPFDHEQNRINNEMRIKIATARCARVSYNNFEGSEDYAKDIELFNRLFSEVPRHCSPAEHLARVPMDGRELLHMGCGWDYSLQPGVQQYKVGKYFSNLRGWIQLRKLIECDEFGTK